MNRALSAAERTQLLEGTRAVPRDHLLFHVALGGPLVARDVIAVDVGDVVTEDGTKIREVISIHGQDTRRAGRVKRLFYLSPPARQIAAEVIAEQKKWCLHSSAGRQLGTYSEADGLERCHACRRPVDWRRWPLFESSSRGRRLSPSQARKRFAGWRRRLGWADSLGFECLRVTFEARAAEALREGLSGHA
jgi:hypothetical protein